MKAKDWFDIGNPKIHQVCTRGAAPVQEFSPGSETMSMRFPISEAPGRLWIGIPIEVENSVRTALHGTH
jgi:hypothetical protein